MYDNYFGEHFLMMALNAYHQQEMKGDNTIYISQ